MGIYYRGHMIWLDATRQGAWVVSVAPLRSAGQPQRGEAARLKEVGEFVHRGDALAAARAYIDGNAIPLPRGTAGCPPQVGRAVARTPAVPTDTPREPGREQPSRNAGRTRAPGGGPHEILLIGDDRVARWSLMRALLVAGYRVRAAATAEEGRAEAEHAPPELVLLDTQLPDDDGGSVLQALHRSHPDLPVVMLSADATPETVQRLRDQGASGFLTKPCAALLLLTLVASLL